MDGSQNFSKFRGSFPKVQRYAIIWFLIYNCGPFIRVLPLFSRNFSVGPVFMTQPVFQSLLVDHIWMLLLFQRMFWEGQVLMLLYLIVDNLYDTSPGLEDFSSWSRILPIVKRLNSCSLWSSFEYFTMRKFWEGPALSVGPFQKVQLEVIYFYVIRKNKKPP